jgi:hypothetical protein
MIKVAKNKASAASQKRAVAMLSKLKPYDQWVATASKEQLESIEQVAGGTRKFYDEMVASLLRLAGPDYQLPEHLK